MLFYTWPFLCFLLIVLPAFFALRKTPFWLLGLIAASYFFYGWWNPYYLVLIFYITVVVFILAALMDRCPVENQKTNLRARLLRFQFNDRLVKTAFILFILGSLVFGGMAWAGPQTLRPFAGGLGLIMLLMALGALYGSREIWLVVGLFNAGVPLLFFKYARFISENLNAVLSWLHIPAKLPDASALMPFGLDYLLPIGISFFTFQAMGYLIDLYLGKTARERNLLRFANFVCFFPQLMAGPIERAEQLLPQFRQFPAICAQNFTDALSLFLTGLFKKMVLAGWLALYVERVYAAPQTFGAPALILASVAYAWQIFFDFGGYTDMARGVAKLMGFNLVLNFNHPYLATGLGDFWRRWHISFSRWILDYIFMPLQMRWRTWRNAGIALALVVTFLVSGIWHGAAWTFVAWGALHGLGLAGTFGLERSAFYRKRVPKIVKQFFVFTFVTFTWIFFRAQSLPEALLIIRRIFTAAWQDPQIPVLILVLVGLVWIYEFLCESRFQDVLKTGFVRVGIAVLMVLGLFFSSSGGSAFIYFQF
ncbi:MAG: MBOAT family protein [Verrucomicrobia bacterium]|nr:MBOAT family protein [Verrucomicrobiota bacterium]MBU1735768.1 MBOAT family protein [Verrucomicrobiota bacterium]MBU1855576.1 MBOAT family protein [Verrucomicrobiota bacterium]